MKCKTVPAIPGVQFSAIGLGCWSLGGGSRWEGSNDERSIATVRRAIEEGVNFIDTAPVYGFGESERVLGEALQGRRDKVFLASKCGLVWDEARTISRSLTASTVHSDVEASLRRLRTDHLDLLQLHWPDHNTPLEETARALDDLLRSGKVRRIGVSNFSVADADALSRMIPIVSCQALYNLLERNPATYHAIPLEYRTEKDVLPYCREKGFAFLPYSPLFQGLLTGSFSRETRFTADDVRSENPNLKGPAFQRYLAAADALKSVAEGEGLSLTALSLAWLCNRPEVTSVICGAQAPEQIAANASASEVELSEGALSRIEQIVADVERPVRP
jgi:aryl-alcohol dehydrogenase-like predicted oxidoreductase